MTICRFRDQESKFFQDLDEDAYTPMQILAMVELSECRPICGGSVVDGQDMRPPENKDTCIAIAGLPPPSGESFAPYGREKR